MKRLIYLSFLGLIALSSCNNQSKDNKETNTKTDSVETKTELSKSFYKRLEGTIGGKPVIMHLLRNENDFSGVYYYQGTWMNLSIKKVINKDSISLFENGAYDYYVDQNAKPSKLSLKWTGSGFKGTWKGPKSAKTYPVLLKEKYPAGSLAFSYNQFTDSAKAFPDKTKSPASTISYKYLIAEGSTKSVTWLNKQVKEILQLKESDTDLSKDLKNSADKYFADYRHDIKESIAENGYDSTETFLDYSNDDDLSILYNDKGFTIIEHLNSSYTGGAHGNYGSHMYCFDTKNLKKLAFEDVVKIDSNTLQTILEQNFRKLYNIKPGDKISTVLFDDYLKPNENFYFNDNGIAFMYNPYEVASYAQGQIIVFIPFNQLRKYINPVFAQRIGLK